MILHSTKPIVRQFFKRNSLKWLNLFGLTIGITFAIIITTYIFNELQVGKTQKDYQKLFLLKSEDGAWHSANTIDAIKSSVPEMKNTTAFHSQWGEAFLKTDETTVNAKDILIGEPSFFNVFLHNSIIGNAKHALSDPNGFVITQNLAHKIFGDKDPIGKTLTFKSEYFGEINLVVNAVIEDVSTNALLKFSGIINKTALHKAEWYKSGLTHWGNSNYIVFSKLNENANEVEVAQKITETIKANAPDWIVKDKKSFSLTNISKLHFDDTKAGSLVKKNKKTRLLTLGIIAFFLLIIGWINFVNLVTAQKDRLNHLVSIKKSLGASRKNLIINSILEILPTIVIAFLLSLFIIGISYQSFNYFTKANIQFIDFFNARTVIFMLLFSLATLFICSILPHWFIQKKAAANNNLRGSLSVFQFAISIGLIISTVVILKQNEFVKTRNAGYASENIICVELKGEVQNKARLFGDKIRNYSSVEDITYSSNLISNINSEWGMSLTNKGEQKRIKYNSIEVDKNFFSFFNIQIIEGQGFNKISEKQNHHIFNETALRQFGVDDFRQARISSYGNATGDIIGKVKDFNFRSLHFPITALGFIERKPKNLGFLYIKLNSNSPKIIDQCIASIEKDWEEIESGWKAEVIFLSESTKQLYDADKKFSKLILIVAFTSILISCIGLLGVSKFIVEKRTKEVGIRKVNGAKISEILALLNIDFVKWVTVAFLVSCPITYYFMKKWLENFAYKTELNWWIFALAGVLALGIALVTVSWQSWRAATRNPLEALRYE